MPRTGSRRYNGPAWQVVVLAAFLLLLIDFLVVVVHIGLCNGNIKAGTARALLCRPAVDVVYLGFLALPSVALLVGARLVTTARRWWRAAGFLFATSILLGGIFFTVAVY